MKFAIYMGQKIDLGRLHLWENAFFRVHRAKLHHPGTLSNNTNALKLEINLSIF